MKISVDCDIECFMLLDILLSPFSEARSHVTSVKQMFSKLLLWLYQKALNKPLKVRGASLGKLNKG